MTRIIARLIVEAPEQRGRRSAAPNAQSGSRWLTDEDARVHGIGVYRMTADELRRAYPKRLSTVVVSFRASSDVAATTAITDSERDVEKPKVHAL